MSSLTTTVNSWSPVTPKIEWTTIETLRYPTDLKHAGFFNINNIEEDTINANIDDKLYSFQYTDGYCAGDFKALLMATNVDTNGCSYGNLIITGPRINNAIYIGLIWDSEFRQWHRINDRENYFPKYNRATTGWFLDKFKSQSTYSASLDNDSSLFYSYKTVNSGILDNSDGNPYTTTMTLSTGLENWFLVIFTKAYNTDSSSPAISVRNGILDYAVTNWTCSSSRVIVHPLYKKVSYTNDVFNFDLRIIQLPSGYDSEITISVTTDCNFDNSSNYYSIDLTAYGCAY